ncbi:uncharacterized protein LOC129716764 [Wyeomyia smithii]|uniref:uncharacterized protein LOC129716764 n=1 Tax=Wyeomyia smithii TaxID=174621 RepID=UPI002467CF8B|nr:uncharacterized protein LOC129716764 [Wyeomyia smithii]
MAQPVAKHMQTQKQGYKMKDMTRNSPVENISVPSVEKQRKKYKVKDLSRELAAEKAKNIQLMEELEQSQRINEELLANQAEKEANRSDFESETPFSSTRRVSAVANFEDSRSFLNQK